MQYIAPKPGQAIPILRRTTTLPGTLESIAAARRWVTTTLTEWGIRPTYDIELIVSELTTNAVAHTTSGQKGGQYTVHLSAYPDRVRVEVRDTGPEHGHTPTRLCVHPSAEHGRGLALVEAVADQWGTLTFGTGVWAEVER